MMHILRKWYYENKDKIWKWILIAIAFFVILKIVNKYYKEKINSQNSYVNNENEIVDISEILENTSEELDEENNYNEEDDENEYEEEDDDEYSTYSNTNNSNISNLESKYSIIDGENVNSSTLKSAEEIIDLFMDYCNNSNLEEAYKLISEDCKNEMYNTVDEFKNKYYNSLFITKKTYSLQNWTSNTYKVKIYDDPLTTGKTASNSTTYQDYITIVTENSETKININNYVGKKNINKVTKSNSIEITVNYKKMYIEYEEYNITMKNLSDKTIALDNGMKTNTIYIQDENDIKSYASTGEIAYDNLKLKSNEIKSYTIKFSGGYSSTRKIKYLVFKNVITDYESYIASDNKKNYSNNLTIMAKL